MHYKESTTIELKSEFIPDIKKEIVAFANTEGGTIYVGIDDDGEIVGVENSEKVLLQVINMLRDSIKPNVTTFTSCKIETLDNKDVIAIRVQRGTNTPYYISDKGLKPSGVYVRQGTTSVLASKHAIRQMIKETDGDKFEEIRSFNQDLTFEAALNEFKKRGLALSETQMKTLGFISNDNLFTNLGLLLKQMTAAYGFIDLVNKTKAEFVGLERIDYRDYPDEALREALMSSIVHRNFY